MNVEKYDKIEYLLTVKALNKPYMEGGFAYLMEDI